MNAKKSKISTYDLVYIALGTALITICAWLTIPYTIPFTMQTFAVFFIAACLGPIRGFTSVLVYLLLGILGVPVFSGIRGGLDVLLGVTGGYLIGFLFSALVTGFFMKLPGKPFLIMIIGMVLGLIVCYFFGTIWFMVVYLQKGKEIGFIAVLLKCVIPYLIPDALKIALAAIIAQQIRRTNIIKLNK